MARAAAGSAPAAGRARRGGRAGWGWWASAWCRPAARGGRRRGGVGGAPGWAGSSAPPPFGLPDLGRDSGGVGIAAVAALDRRLVLVVEPADPADEVGGEDVRGAVEARGGEGGVVEEAQQALGAAAVDQAGDQVLRGRTDRVEPLERAAQRVEEGLRVVEGRAPLDRGVAETSERGPRRAGERLELLAERLRRRRRAAQAAQDRHRLDREGVELAQRGLGLAEQPREPRDALAERVVMGAEALADGGELADEAVDRLRIRRDRRQDLVGLVDPVLERRPLAVEGARARAGTAPGPGWRCG